MGRQLLMAITIHRPWPYAFLHLGKAVENRTWKCPLKPGEWIAIHAGKRYDKQGADWIHQSLGLNLPPDGSEHPTGIVALAQFRSNVTSHDSPWFTGPVGWTFSSVIPVHPVIHCNGQQGLWKVPGDHLPLLRQAWYMAGAL